MLSTSTHYASVHLQSKNKGSCLLWIVQLITLFGVCSILRRMHSPHVMRSNTHDMSRMCCFGTMKITSIEPPQRPRLTRNHEESTWSPYPDSYDPTLAHTACMFNSFCGVNCIQFEICQSLFAADKRPSGSELDLTVNTFYERLQVWHEQIPSCISTENLSAPHIVNLQ